MRPGDKDQGDPTVLKWPLESVLVGQKYFIDCNLERDVRLKAEKIRQKIPEKMDQETFYAIEERG